MKDKAQTKLPPSSTGPGSPIKSLREVVLGRDTNRFESLIENPEITDVDPTTLSAAVHSDAVPPDNAATSVLTGNLAHPVSNEVPTIAVQGVSSAENPASGHTYMDSPKDRGAPKGGTPPDQPLLMQTNKKSSSGKRNKRRSTP
ncbi:hypothetical protein U1Q18_011352 [Sarracenia purpurea var. burkii]